MDVTSAIGQEKARSRTCQVNSEESPTAQAFRVEVLITHLMQEVIEEVDDHLIRETERCETSRIGSEKDLCLRPWQLLRR